MKNEIDNQEWWDAYRTESFEAIRATINRIEEKLKVYSSQEAFEFLKPMRYLISGAEMQLDEEQQKRIATGEVLINNLINNSFTEEGSLGE